MSVENLVVFSCAAMIYWKAAVAVCRKPRAAPMKGIPTVPRAQLFTDTLSEENY